MNLHPVHCAKLLAGLAIVVTLAVPLRAQESGRGGSELDLLRREDVLQENGVSTEVIATIDELRRRTTTTRAVFEEFKEEMRATKTEEERTVIRAKIQEAVKSGGARFQQQARELLNPDQQQQLRRVYIEDIGLNALADDRIAADLELADAQRTRINELLEDRRKTESEEGSSADDRDAAQRVSDARLLAVLSQEQLSVWKQFSASGQDAGATVNTGDSGPPAASGPAASISDTPSLPTGETVADFGAGFTEPWEEIQAFSFSFRHAPWERVLQMFADGAGLTLDMQRVPPGSLSHLDHHQYSAWQALDIINGYLIRKGFSLVRKDGFLIVVNLDEQLDLKSGSGSQSGRTQKKR
jgi:hypothetical protein